jgi:hypothetical protein
MKCLGQTYIAWLCRLSVMEKFAPENCGLLLLAATPENGEKGKL